MYTCRIYRVDTNHNQNKHQSHNEREREKKTCMKNLVKRRMGVSTKMFPKKTVRVNTVGDLLLCCFTNIRWTPGGSTVLLKLVCPSDPLRVSHCQFRVVPSLSGPPVLRRRSLIVLFLLLCTRQFSFQNCFPTTSVVLYITYCGNLFCYSCFFRMIFIFYF